MSEENNDDCSEPKAKKSKYRTYRDDASIQVSFHSIFFSFLIDLCKKITIFL